MIRRFLRNFGLFRSPAPASQKVEETILTETQRQAAETSADLPAIESPKVHLIPQDYPEVKDPEMPQFELLNGVQAYFRDNYNPKRNCVVESGTGTGKTVLAYIASRYVLDEVQRAILIVPSRALATDQEKMAWGIWGAGVVARNTGRDDRKLESKNFIISTPEGYISAVRQQKEWTTASLLIVDEGHNLVGDRGGMFDVVITLHLKAGGRVLIMSGTLPNKEALAKYYNADLFVSQYVKTKLNDNPYVECPDDIDAVEAPKELPLGIVPTLSGYVYRRDSIRILELKKKLTEYEGKSVLIFVPTKAIGYCLSESLVSPFHCADLEETERNRIVDEFNAGIIKVVIATNTLSEGVNTAADVVLICGSRSGGGRNFFDLNQVKQMFGRAGRNRNVAFAFFLGDRIEIAHAKKFYVVNSLPLPLETMILTLLSIQSATKESLCIALRDTLAGSMSSPEKISNAVDGYLHFLKSCNILQEKEKKYALTTEGALLARYFISPRDYISYIIIARRLMKVPTAVANVAAAPPNGEVQDSLLPGAGDPAAATVCMTPEEKGCILIATILSQMVARNCPPKILKELKFKLIPLEIEETVNVPRAGLLIHYMYKPSAISPYLKFQINDVARWVGMFKDMMKFGVHAETPGKADIEAALKPLKIAIAKNEEIMRKKAASQKKTGSKGKVVTLVPHKQAVKNVAA